MKKKEGLPNKLEKGSYWITYDVKGRGYAELSLEKTTEVTDALNLYFLLHGVEITQQEVTIKKIEKQ